MFVVFETNTRLLFYHYYISKDDKKHSEFYILQDKDRIMTQIDKRLQDLYEIPEYDKCDMNMTVFSKNASCDACAIKHEYIIKLRDEVNSNPDLPDIVNTEIQILRTYDNKTEGNKANVPSCMCKSQCKSGIQHYEKSKISTKPVDWIKLYALFVQWCESRKDCEYTYMDPKRADPKDCSNHIHEVDDEKYRQVMRTLPGKVNDDQMKQELLRLGNEDSEEEIEKKKDSEKRKKEFVENIDRHDLEKCISEHSGKSDK